MLRRSRSARWTESAHRQVLFAERVDEIIYANRSDDEDKDELEEELAELIGEPLTKQPPVQISREEELAEELEAILHDCSIDSTEDEIDQTGPCRSLVRTPLLVESATSGCSVEMEPEKHCVSDAVQVDFTSIPAEPCLKISVTDQRRPFRNARVKRVLGLLNQRRRDLCLAAYQAQQVGEMELAKQHACGVKNVTAIMRAVDNGKPINLAQLPSKPCLNTVFNGPVLSGVVCDAPALVRLDLEQASDTLEQEKILTSLLKAQIIEATQLAKEQRFIKCPRTAEELTEIANGSQSTITMLSVQHRHPISLIPQFRTATLPVVNKNGDIADGVVEITVAWGLKVTSLNTSDAFQIPASYVHILFPYPSESDGQSHLSTKVPFSNRYSRGRSVKEIRVNTKSWFVRRWASIRLNLFLCDITDQKSNGRLLETLIIPLRELEHLATVTSTHILPNQFGVVEVKLCQRIPTSGSHLITRVKPWLCVTAVPVVSIQPVSTTRSLDQSTPNLGSRVPTNPLGASFSENISTTSLSSGSTTGSTALNEGTAVQNRGNKLHKIPKSDKDRELNIRNNNSISVLKKSVAPTRLHSKPSMVLSVSNDTTLQRAKSSTFSSTITPSNNNVLRRLETGPVRTVTPQSQALLRSQERLHHSRVMDPGVTEEARQYHFAELRRTRALLKNLEQRLSGPNSVQERQNYLLDLEKLKAHLELLSQEAKKSKDIPSWTGYQYKLNVINEEIRSLK
ncbi:hypothetical protein FGIG_05417 [Fasciola gigantica]|uniref:DM14 domain-containing protein n=1 Tax=Fasciola gigantica TaxID=46835 RepID=A0A504Y3A6_FASGI|nr:hypothetical protein FGIG_05417 [Fasciola gigantica]